MLRKLENKIVREMKRAGVCWFGTNSANKQTRLNGNKTRVCVCASTILLPEIILLDKTHTQHLFLLVWEDLPLLLRGPINPTCSSHKTQINELLSLNHISICIRAFLANSNSPPTRRRLFPFMATNRFYRA